MFNQLTSADVVRAIGGTLRDAARTEQELSEFERDQLMSAYSATRHLSVELSAYPLLMAAFRDQLSGLLHERASVADRARVDAAQDSAELGAALCELLAGLRAAGSDEARSLRSAVQAALRRLADDEVDLVADGLR